ncbi:MAG TPA: hypothetical protein VGK73_17575 [Polyangiaceae bacterium]
MASEAKKIRSVSELSALRDKLKADHKSKNESARKEARVRSYELRQARIKLATAALRPNATDADKAALAAHDAMIAGVECELAALTRPPALDAVMAELREARTLARAERLSGAVESLGDLLALEDQALESLHHDLAAELELVSVQLGAKLQAVSAERGRRAAIEARKQLTKGLTLEEKRALLRHLQGEIDAEKK